MSKQNILIEPLPSVFSGFYRGLAQMSGMGRVKPLMPPRRQTATESFSEDWARLGFDMTRAIEKVRSSVEETSSAKTEASRRAAARRG